MCRTILTVVISFTLCVVVGFFLVLFVVSGQFLRFLERTDWYAVGTFVGITIRYTIYMLPWMVLGIVLYYGLRFVLRRAAMRRH